MIDMAVGMLAICSTWLLAFLSFCGIGFWVQRAFGLRARDPELALLAFWIGWGSVIAALQILHLFVPINGAVAVPVALIGLAGLLANRDRLVPLSAADKALRIPFLAVSCLLVLWLANRAMGALGPYDAGLYHVSATRWTAACPAVPGLGNLHGRLAFGSSHFFYIALLDVRPWWHLSHHLASGLLLAVLGVQLVLHCMRAVAGRGEIAIHSVFSVALLVPIVHQCLEHSVSTSPDLPVFILGAVLGTQLCRLLFAQDGPGEAAFGVFAIVFLAAVGISVKLSFLAMGTLCSIVALARAPARARWLFVPVALVLLPWMARNVIASGYVVYPSTLRVVDTDWRVPENRAIAEQKEVRSWARQPHGDPDEVLAGWRWLGPWLRRLVGEQRHIVGIVLPFVLGLGVLIVDALRRRGSPADRWWSAAFMLPAVGGVLFWFLTAPEPRFAGVTFWYWAAGAMAIHCRRYSVSARWRFARAVLAFSVALTLVTTLKHNKFVDPGPHGGFHPMPVAELATSVTESGLAVHVPTDGDQCWDAPLPCAPHVSPKLRLRKPGVLRSGFTASP